MAEAIKAYPLAWPHGWKRTPAGERKKGRFFRGERDYAVGYMRQKDVTIADAVERVRSEIAALLGRRHEHDLVISTNLKTRLDGLPMSNQAQPADPGAAVYWRDSRMDGWPARCMAVDRYKLVEHNLAAIAATLDAMRAIERHGGAEILDRAFTGFAALPAPGQSSRDWRKVLEVDVIVPEGGVVTPEVVNICFRRLASKHHPDHGGDPSAFHELTAARDQALAAIGCMGA